jgi:hypothetical protein
LTAITIHKPVVTGALLGLGLGTGFAIVWLVILLVVAVLDDVITGWGGWI